MQVATGVVMTLLIGTQAAPLMAQDQIAVESPPQNQFLYDAVEGGWYCAGTRGQLLDLQFSFGDIRLNNIAITEASDFMSNAPVVRLSASVVNPTAQRAFVALEAIGIGFNEDGIAYPAFALNAREQWGSIQPGTSAEMTASTYGTEASATAEQFCVRPFVRLEQQL